MFKVIQRANKYIDESMPWALAKDMEANGARLAHVLYNLLEATRICGILLTPFIPASCDKIFDQIGACEGCRTWDSAARWGSRPETALVTKGANLFPPGGHGPGPGRAGGHPRRPAAPAQPAIELEPWEEDVDFDTFCRSDFRAVKIKSCEAVKKSEKLLKFILDDGTGTDRQILSGIAMYYKPGRPGGQDPGGHREPAPRKMMGQESQGCSCPLCTRRTGRKSST